MAKTINRTRGVVRFMFKDAIKNLKIKPTKQSLIYLNFSYGGGKKFKYSTGFKSCWVDWNEGRQRIKEGKAGLLDADKINEHLSNLENDLKKEYSRLLAEGLPISKEGLKQFLDLKTGKIVISDEKKITFYDSLEKFEKIRSAKESKNTAKQHKQTINVIKKYDKKRQITFDSFDKEFYSQFITHLEEEGYALNTIGKHIKNLKAFLRFGLEEEYHTNIKFTKYEVPKEDSISVYLDENEIEKLHKTDLSFDKRWEVTRDVFLIGCYTGQRISDYNGLNLNDISTINGKEYFQIFQQKTGNEVSVPITTEIREIMQRYNNQPPPKIYEQDLNDDIKKICRKIGLKNKVKIIKTKGGKKTTESIEKHKLISSHTARRSFCTNLYKKGMPTIDIRYFSGHKSEKEFFNYIKIKDQERASHIVETGKYFNI
ncbi:tyrosine-type recombinase/integrase [Leeuwenhoekiella marinoflava]|uniref:Site-specific recombinase XerD n=2 Tax=Leeuwenhoekiella marinoflava TaxID=988 RepID=A0A4Q0PQU4_9FLAO|nr:site-specific integrase [Leeuwenhoekiella marinoflava]RXG33010.1 site-specific recombinase XerD [Leeuwenhoekiella marinoflava]SHE35365.1 Site-specific recombinase XerD [Leeuwenhoekiella marinoflava DSM 3653]